MSPFASVVFSVIKPHMSNHLLFFTLVNLSPTLLITVLCETKRRCLGVSCCEPRSFACWISCVDCIGSVFRSVHSILRGAVHHSFLSHVSRSLSLRLLFVLVVPHQYLLICYGSIRSCGVAVRCGYAVLVLVSQGGICTILVLRIQHYVSGRGRVETGISA